MNETRKAILNSLEVLMKEMPEQRVGQIIFNYICSNCPNNDCFFIEDTKLLELLETITKEIEEK